ncbi:MAG: 2-C-methyl-D-erythritol 2,4-cyclodiphosphate synthase [Candidatus Omnitrophota bacterium]|nr:2-C-methyl-D-erythritol 2,4-cyclodiphosphate synthase [Candidatus Omnitrophota bacterium]
MRVGIGYDIHRLVEGRKLILGGIEIPHIKGLDGYSDGDILLHAVCDAILGALGQGDIGRHFPSSQAAYKDISSIKLLKRVLDIMTQKKFQIENIDTIVIAEQPRLLPFRERIEIEISRILELDKYQVNVKFKTNESMDSIGRKESIAGYAVVCLKEQPE